MLGGLMNISLAALAPIAGILGVIVGALLNETIRRRNRRELYAPKIFEKRLAAYEALLAAIQQGSHIATNVMDNDDLSKEQRHDLISAAVHEVADVTETHKLYLDEELTVHCMALFMGVEEIHDAAEADRQAMRDHYYGMRKEAIRMITEDSGVSEINRLFKSVNKPKIRGELIEYFRDLKKKS